MIDIYVFRYFDLFGKLPETKQRLANLLGINESFLYKKAMSGNESDSKSAV
jgi:hypothetical protein